MNADKPAPLSATGDVEHRRAEGMDLPPRIVVDARGFYWRDYGDHYSMCPVSEDNEPVKPAAVYVPDDAARSTGSEGLRAKIADLRLHAMAYTKERAGFDDALDAISEWLAAQPVPADSREEFPF